MLSLKAGDRVSCRIHQNIIVAKDSKYDNIQTFEVIAADDCGIFLFVPQYIYLQGSSRIDLARCQKLGVRPQFHDEMSIYILDNMVASVRQQMDGMLCKKCLQFFDYATANQDDGSLICFSCRKYPNYF
jgi:hypothetical protein